MAGNKLKEKVKRTIKIGEVDAKALIRGRFNGRFG
jgi:hypothetical protein